ncbi:hypothetical protein F5Y00DRAFT_271468 [Daldinia vernicosa]|uniref:uncharacterized protein n=1 Tax=Daldinia vernicosa TaxID=114800 RepID=UPI0020089895|nr:uncharacterized protein F5Y00DRAFT_271468 [Daldinia vernicosa]KAI0846998.1 hypothetical protein F5Y00DRAFT_271468 [Daldinia vernicosa]
MASTISSSTTSSSPVSFQDPEDLTIELQPAPLRLPRRKTVPNLDGTNSATEEQISVIGGNDSTLTAHRESINPPPITKSLSQRRAPAHKLGPLVSKFETLDAVKNADTISPLDSKPGAIPRVQRPLRHSRASESLQSIASEKYSTPANSLDVPPRRVESPPPFSNRPKLPVKTVPKKASVEDNVEASSSFRGAVNEDIFIKEKGQAPEKDVSPIRELKEGNRNSDNPRNVTSPADSPITKSTSSTSNQLAAQKTVSTLATSSSQPFLSFNSSQGNSPTKSKLQTVSTDSPLKYSQKGIVDQDGQSHHHVEHPARRKHESTASSKIPVRRAQMSVADIRKSFEKSTQAPGPEPQMPNKSKLSSEIMNDRVTRISKETVYSRHSGSRRSISPTRTTAQKDSIAVQPPHNRKSIHTRSENRLSEHSIPVPYTTNTSGLTTTAYQPDNSRLRRINNRNLDGAVSLEDEGALDAEGGANEPSATAIPDSQAIRGNKSSRTSRIHSILVNNSKASFHNILASRHPIANDGVTPESGRVQKPASKPVSKPASAARCSGKVSDLRRLFERSSPRESSPNLMISLVTSLSHRMSIKQESPVKDRIQQFESLETVPLDNSSTPSYYDVNSNISPHKQKTDAGRIEPEGIQRSLRQRKARLWRRISNTFTRSIDRGNSNSNDGEQSGSGRDDDINNVPSSSIRRRPRYRRSNLFGYHLYRTSEVIQSSTGSGYTRSNININEELIEKLDNQPPYIAYRQSPSSYLSMRRTFPFLARMSDNLGCSDEFDDFGLDGSVLSKATRRRYKPSVGQDAQGPSSPVSCSDSNAVSSTTSKQTTTKRKRRRLEEKELRREQRRKNREKAMEKGKGKETAVGDNQGAESTQDKEKGKDTESKKKERSWSKKTASGFMVRQINDIKLKHPKPRRPGQIRKIVNMYKDKSTSGIRLGKGSGVSSGSGTAGTAGASSN